MGKQHYSCTDLAKFRIPGYPTTRQGWDAYIKSEGWSYVEVKSRGRKGATREYEVPEKIRLLISDEAHQAAASGGEVKVKTLLENGADYVKYQPEMTATPLKAEDRPRGLDDESVYIDKYVNVKGAAGVGQEVHDEAIVQVRVDARLLRERIGNNIGRIKIASVSGDSMEPTLSHGDQVLIDTSIDRFIENAIYAIQQDGHLRFKRIKLKLDGSIIVKSDNPLYNEPETYTADEAQYFKVIGVVIPFKFGRFKI